MNRSFLLFLFCFLVSQVSGAVGFIEDSDFDERVESFVNSMTVEQKVGQLLIFGFAGTNVNQTLKRTIHRYDPGSIIIFKRNIETPEQLARLNYEAQKLSMKSSGLPLFTMVDQEGGVVSRIKTRPFAPSALSIGMTQNPAIAQRTGFVTGKILGLLGINMNLAPVVDISDPNQSNFIGNRSFGKDPALVKNITRRFISGLGDSGVIATLKHFPGHGGSIRDSHKAHSKKYTNLPELMKSDLIPYKNTQEFLFPTAVMVAHIAFPNVDQEGLPATFSRELVTNVLQNQLGYEGLVITDDIEMYGATVFSSVGERAIRAIEAGNDMVMVAWTRKNQYRAFTALVKAVKTGRLKESRVDKSLRKIISAKLSLKNKIPESFKADDFRKTINKYVNELKGTANLVTMRNIDRAFFTKPKLKGSVPIETNIRMFSADWRFFSSYKKKSLNNVKYYPLSPKKSSPVRGIMNAKKKDIGIYYVTGKGTARLINAEPSKIKKRMIIVNATSPGEITNRHQYMGVIDINSRNFNAGGWVAEYLNGKRPLLRKPASKNVSKTE